MEKVTGKHVQQCLERAFKNNTRTVDYFDLNHVEGKGQEVYLYLNKPSGALLNNLCEPLLQSMMPVKVMKILRVIQFVQVHLSLMTLFQKNNRNK